MKYQVIQSISQSINLINRESVKYEIESVTRL